MSFSFFLYKALYGFRIRWAAGGSEEGSSVAASSTNPKAYSSSVDWQLITSWWRWLFKHQNHWDPLSPKSDHHLSTTNGWTLCSYSVQADSASGLHGTFLWFMRLFFCFCRTDTHFVASFYALGMAWLRGLYTPLFSLLVSQVTLCLCPEVLVSLTCIAGSVGSALLVSLFSLCLGGGFRSTHWWNPNKAL